MVFLLPLVILVIGGVYIVFLRKTSSDGAGWRAVALTGLISGIVAAMLTALAVVLSMTSLLDNTTFSGLLGVVAFLGIPAALVGVGV